jgi:radical SAM superfamily enzyme YgiQ (UPF0313 family)
LKIAFIEPPYGLFIEDLDAPFSLMYLAGVAEENGWQAQIVDMKTLDDKLPEADVYAVTSTSPQWPTTVKLSSRLYKEFPDKLKIIGGPHISAIPEDFDYSKFDMAVLGEGEKALAQILHNPHSHIGSHIVVHGEPVENLDEVPFPARHLIDWTKYKRGIYWGKKLLSPAVSFISSRGCPHNCCFCGSHVVFGRRVRFRSTENVVAEIKQVIDTMGYRGFNFHDDTFCINRKQVVSLCREFAKLNIVWRCLTRADTIDEKLLMTMREGGCKELLLGVESGSQQILNNLQKGTTVKQNLEAMKMIDRSGIQVKAGIIVGSPGETWQTVEETKKLLKQCPPAFWNLSVFTPFPGSAVWEHPKKYGIKILTRDLTQYAMVGKDFKGNVVIETEQMTKSDIEQARDELLELLFEIAP